MKRRSLSILIIMTTLALGTNTRGGVVYQSDFTGTNLASAGLASIGESGGIWDFNAPADRVQVNFPGGNDRSSVYTTNSWQNDLGFTLNVTFLQNVAGTRFTIGILDAAHTVDAGLDWINQAPSGAYGIGFTSDGELENTNGDADLLGFNNGSTSTNLGDAQGNITLNTLQTLSITVTSTNYSYSLNGTTATTGAITFDTSRNFRFIAYAQRGTPNLTGSYISNITLDALESGLSAENGILQAGYNSVSQQIMIAWQSEPNASYDIEAAPEISDSASFTSLVQNIVATSVTTSVEIPVPADPRMFYRVYRP